jgi:ribonuclease P protein component
MDYKPAGCPPLKNLCSFSQKDAQNVLKNGSFLARIPGLKIIETPFGEKSVPTSPHGRMLIVIPRKVGPACTRNLIRRRIRALYFEEKLFSRTCATSIFVYPEARSYSYKQLKEFLKQAFTAKSKKHSKPSTAQ